MQHAKHMRRIILPAVDRLVVPYSAALSHESKIFGNELFDIKCVLNFSTTFV
jgi:hypothetical protein